MENPTRMDDFGVPLFQETSNFHCTIVASITEFLCCIICSLQNLAIWQPVDCTSVITRGVWVPMGLASLSQQPPSHIGCRPDSYSQILYCLVEPSI